MQLILAIDSDPRRSEQLANLVRARLEVDLVQATSAGEGLHALRDRVPDLILTSPLLSPFDDGVLDEYLRDLGSAATHVQTVRIPMLSTGPRKKSAAGRLFSLGRKKTPTSSAAPDGCDPKVFADEIAHYLTRSLEEKASAKTTGDRTAPATPAPARAPEPQAEPVVQFVDEWAPPEALVQEFRETVSADWRAEEAAAEPAPVVEDMHVPGSILDLRAPIAHAPQRVGVAQRRPIVVAEPDAVEFSEYARDFAQDLAFDAAQGRPVSIEPEPVSESPVLVEPEAVAYITPEPVTDGQSAPVIRKPETITKPAPISAPVGTPKPAGAATETGNSASFEAALAAIRAAWAKPEPKAPPQPAPGSAGSPRPLAASGEVDLTKAIDALEDVTGVDGSTPSSDDSPDDSTTPKARPKVEKPAKRPEKPRGRSLRGPGDRDDWDAFDPKQYEFSALVNKLDEVTESDKATKRATNGR